MALRWRCDYRGSAFFPVTAAGNALGPCSRQKFGTIAAKIRTIRPNARIMEDAGSNPFRKPKWTGIQSSNCRCKLLPVSCAGVTEHSNLIQPKFRRRDLTFCVGLSQQRRVPSTARLRSSRSASTVAIGWRFEIRAATFSGRSRPFLRTGRTAKSPSSWQPPRSFKGRGSRVGGYFASCVRHQAIFSAVLVGAAPIGAERLAGALRTASADAGASAS